MLNSIVEGNEDVGIGLSWSENSTIAYSDFYNNENGNFYNPPEGVGAIVTINANGDSCDQFNNIFLDPLFYSTTGDSAFYLTGESPCIDAGDPASSYANEPQPNGGCINQGVYGNTSEATLSNVEYAMPRDKWVILGIPVTVPDGSPGTLVQDDFGGSPPNGSNWRVSCWDAEHEGYIRYEEVNSPGVPAGNPPDFTPGLGFWLVQDVENDCQLDILSSQLTGVVPEDSPFSVELTAPGTDSYRGLVQIANPFNYTYTWYNTTVYDSSGSERKTVNEAAVSGWVSGYAYVWDSDGDEYVNTNFNPDSTNNITLNAWQGFWMEQVDETKNLSVEFTPQGMLDFTPNLHQKDETDLSKRWSIQLQVVTLEGDFSNANNILGIDNAANDGYDFLDAMEFTPQSSAGWVQLYFPHPEWPLLAEKFSYDYRSTDFPNVFKEWDFIARCYDLSDRDFKLIWPNLEDIPKRYYFTLEYKNADMALVDMREETEFIFRFSDESTYPVVHFCITVSDSGSGIAQPMQDLKFGFISAYPNPSNDQIRITFGLPEAREISLKVFNLLGQEVAILQDGLMSAGEHSVFWKAEGIQASGIYFVQLKAGDKTNVKKVMMLR